MLLRDQPLAVDFSVAIRDPQDTVRFLSVLSNTFHVL
jgi:hypothetical protein